MYISQRFQRTAFFSLLALSTLALTTAQAQLVQTSMERLTQESDAVVVGKVASLSSEWNETKTRIQTRVTIAVDQSVKGDASMTEMTIVIPGGEVGGIGEVYSHAPRFLRDEAVVVFAKKSSTGDYRVSNGSQGKFTVLKDELSNKLVVAGGSSLEEFTATIKTALQSQIMK
jgi:hypothetical protein